MAPGVFSLIMEGKASGGTSVEARAGTGSEPGSKEWLEREARLLIFKGLPLVIYFLG